MKFIGQQDAEMRMMIRTIQVNALDRLAETRKYDMTKVRKLADKVTVDFSTRLRTAAGGCYPLTGVIELHYRLFKKNPKGLKDTYLHELGHYLNRQILKGEGHDESWKRITKDLGGSGERLHNLDITKWRTTRMR